METWADMPSETTTTHVFEQDQPLDGSLLWSWIQHYYAKGGVAVWNDGDIPFHITNTPMLANEWAQSIIASLRDFARLGLLAPERPVEVIELGPGTGRHAYFLLLELKRLEPLTRAFCPQGLRFRLHLAELGVSGLDSLAAHPNLQAPLDAGDLVLHQFDIDKDEVPKLHTPKDGQFELPSLNPVFVVSNYILDSLPHDVIRVDRGEVHLGLTKLSVNDLEEGLSPTDIPDLGEKISLTFRYSEEPASYQNPAWNEVLQHYKSLPGETHIPFPTSSFRLGERSRNWSEVATCFLVADKSFTTMGQLIQLEEPELVPHGGGFSFNANVHGFGLLAQSFTGKFHHTKSRDGTLDLSHILFPAKGQDGREWDMIESDFRHAELEKFHAVDRFRTKESVDELNVDYPLRVCLDLLRSCAFDPQIFYELSDDILRGLEHEEENICEMEDELSDVLPRCLELIFPLADDVDVAFEVGRVAYRMESYELARRAFTISIDQYGDDARSRFNLGLTWYYREQWEKAIKQFSLALDLNPRYEEAKLWKQKAQAKQSLSSTR